MRLFLRGSRRTSVQTFVPKRARQFLRILSLAGSIASVPAAHAQIASSVVFGAEAGLTDLNVRTLVADPSGYTLVGTEHGAYFLDGRRFHNLGARNGLPDGGVVEKLMRTADCRLVVVLSNGIFVADRQLTKLVSPETLHFKRVYDGAHIDFGRYRPMLAIWKNVTVVLGPKELMGVDLVTGREMAVDLQIDGKTLTDARQTIAEIFSSPQSRDTLTIATREGRVCEFDTVHAGKDARGRDVITAAARRCTSAPATPVVWRDGAFAPNGDLWMRASGMIGHVAHAGFRIETFPLGLDNHAQAGEFYPIGILGNKLVITDNNGILYGRVGHWAHLNTNSDGFVWKIRVLAIDQQNRIWSGLQGRGAGLLRGLGNWENWSAGNGLPDDEVNAIAASDHGVLMSFADQTSEYRIQDGRLEPTFSADVSLSAAQVCNPASYVGASMQDRGLYVFDHAIMQRLPDDGNVVWDMVCDGAGSIWIANGRGLSRTEISRRDVPPRSVPGIEGAVVALSAVGPADLWFINHRALHHWHGGQDHVILTRWSEPNFDPRTILGINDDTVWVGGSAGPLYRVTLERDRVVAISTVNPPEITSNTVLALRQDKRGWIWAGTDQGVSVFNGSHWTSLTTADGLIWNDIVEGVISIAPDDTIWFGTTHGVSHLLDPKGIFHQPPLDLAVITAQIGDAPFEGKHPYSHTPVEITFGSLNAQSAADAHFFYRLSGVDQAFVETTDQVVRYPSLPPGTHTFEVYAVNPVNHVRSEMICLTATMAQPWWRWIWVDALAALAVAAAIYGFIRLRTLHLLRREHELELTVAERTRAIKAAQEALVIQATMDGLTRTYNRSAIQDRLDRALRRESGPDDTGLAIGLIDIDYFKRINDLAGHLAGDEVLREFGTRLRENLLPEEHVGRYGGEEFVIMIEGSPDHARGRLARLKSLLTGRAFIFNQEAMRVTCSIGIAHAQPGDTWQTLVARADSSLYVAKQAGRDCIVDGDQDPRMGTIAHRRARRRYRDLTH